LKEEQLEYFAHLNSQTRLAKEVNNSQAKSLRQGLNAVVIKGHEGKTPVTFHVYDAKKILVDALGTLRTTGTLSL
jgi:hypothetical protein